MKSSFLAFFCLSVAIAACSDATPQTTGAGGDGGEQPTTSSGNPTSSSSGMGGAGGAAGAGGAGGAGGAAPALSADKLGQVCGGMMACPMGYSCVLLDPMATMGFCTLPCTGQMDTTTCSMANGFPGPGAGTCAFQVKDAMGMIKTVCGIFCGPQNNNMCPNGLTCQDKFNAMGMPGMDGTNDVCVP